MPARREHRRAAADHLRAYRATVGRFPAWGATMLFYEALHMIEATLAGEGTHNTSHSARELYIKQRHPALWVPYARLQNESKKARYLHGGPFFLSSVRVDRELRRAKLRDVRIYLRSLLGPAR